MWLGDVPKIKTSPPLKKLKAWFFGLSVFVGFKINSVLHSPMDLSCPLRSRGGGHGPAQEDGLSKPASVGVQPLHLPPARYECRGRVFNARAKTFKGHETTKIPSPPWQNRSGMGWPAEGP